MRLRYSTEGHISKSIDTDRWVSSPAWRQVRAPEDLHHITEDDIDPKLGVPHPDGKVVRRSSVR